MGKRILRKRFIIETINKQLKNISRIEHSGHRSVKNFMADSLAGSIAYTWQPEKTTLNRMKEATPLQIIECAISHSGQRRC